MLHPIILTSFKESWKVSSLRGIDALPKPYSAAVYQPHGFSYPKLGIWDIRDEQGRWTRPRDFVKFADPLRAYKDALMGIYVSRAEQIEEWVFGLDHPAVLCCWCPYDRAAQRQIKEHGSFVCHTSVIYEVLKSYDQQVWLDKDRQERMYKTWAL